MTYRNLRAISATTTAVLVGALLAACTSGGGAATDNAIDDEVFVADGYTEPKSGPAAEPGKKVLVMSCGQSQETCSVAADAQIAAAEAIGWEAELVDYNSDYDAAQNKIRSAIAAKYDGILTYALDCPLVTRAISEAHDAGIPIVGAEGQDCESKGYDAIVSYSQGDFPTWFEAFGKKQGEVAIARAGGKGKILVVRETDVPNLDFAYKGLIEAIDECADCEVVDTVEFVATDYGPKLEQKISQALVKNPDVDILTVPYDSILLASALPALRSSGRAKEIVVAAAEGQSGVLDLVRDGSIVATGVAVPQAWEGWASVDALNRVFAGEKSVSSGIGLVAFDSDHNLPESGPFEFPVDYEAAYRKIWGVD
jgi:ribose transport system substrate-binding protein